MTKGNIETANKLHVTYQSPKLPSSSRPEITKDTTRHDFENDRQDPWRSSQSRKSCLALTNNPGLSLSTITKLPRRVFFYGLPSYSFRRWSPTTAASSACLYFGEFIDIILPDSLKILVINARTTRLVVGSLDTGQVSSPSKFSIPCKPAVVLFLARGALYVDGQY
ncbi:hypothetical protein EV421DRAFT_1738310 [Armillaria borealis]|uniref:Uncharacterized protein n=1 Tax=Armillaria borealis TaxID=47425 RepID=A0AA39JA43_9AGAR|nr:hypothetical protein EV421DRAFT_1738310 [Armillaria borealis]